VKTCSKCEISKPVEEFCRDKNRKDGRSPYCRRCSSRTTLRRCRACEQETTKREFDTGTETCRKCLYNTGNKRCSSCRELLPLNEFFASSKRRDGRHVYCRSCSAKKQSALAPHTAAYKRKRNYGLDESAYQRLMTEQNGACFICQKPERRTRLGKPLPLHVDHCHDSGVVRGLLCCDCNLGLGRFKSDSGNLTRAILYLERNRDATDSRPADGDHPA
jgi:hypothetical protein